MITAVIALVPILSLLIFMVVLEKPAYKAATISLLITILAVSLYWRMDGAWINASVIKGFMLASEIMFILVGVFLMIAVLKQGRAFSFINYFVFNLSRDARVQAILMAWFLVSFMEGIAGFGTPSMIAAPLMVSLGFSPFAAVAATLVGDSMSVTFGAAGVPMTIGISEGVSNAQALILGTGFVSQVSIVTALFHSCLGLFLPFAIICLLDFIYSRSFRRALAFWKFSLAAGAAFAAPYLLTAILLGPEFPTIIASIIGGFIVIMLARRRIFFPEDEWVFHNAREAAISELAQHEHRPKFYIKAIVPYIIVVFFLVITRTNLFSIGEFFSNISFPINQISGVAVSHNFAPFYSPGFFFLIAAIVGFFVYRGQVGDIKAIGKSILGKIFKVYVALAAVLAIIQIMVFSDNNISGLPSITNYMMEVLSGTGFFWPIFSPIVGLFGSFIAGSSTVSNLMFSSLQVETAFVVGISPIIGLALQSVGSAVGNMFAVHNVVAASAVVHLEGNEGRIIKYNAVPALIYTILAGVIGLIFVHLF